MGVSPKVLGLFGSIGSESGGSGSVDGDYLSVMPRASTSVNSIYSDVDLELVTPGSGPCAGSGWPDAVVVRGFGFDDVDRTEGGVGVGMTSDADVDTFILRTLAAATKGPKERRASEGGYGLNLKKVPGTPVKKVKTSHNLGGNGDRPWQSAVAAKVGCGFGFGLDMEAKAGVKAGGPRKSMPAVYRVRSRGDDTDSEGEEDSPSFRKEGSYDGLGLGKPGDRDRGGGAFPRTRWLT